MIQGYACLAQGGSLEAYRYDPGPLTGRNVEVAVEFCGICHSDQSMIDNEWGLSQYPFMPGHEAIGTVVAAGPSADQTLLGRRVGVGWQSASCLHCRWCSSGREHLCMDPAEVGATIIGRNGAWAERVRCQDRWTIPLPEGLDPATAGPLMCGGTTVFSPLMHNDVRAGMETAVLGIGGLGHLAVQFLARMGTQVTAISSTRGKEDDARRMGARNFMATREDPKSLEKAAGRFDLILSTVSADLPWDAYINALAPQGTLVICGVPDSALQFQAFPLIGYERRVVGGRTGSPSDMREMFAFCARHEVAPVCEQFPMREVNAAVQHLRDGKARYRIVLANG